MKEDRRSMEDMKEKKEQKRSHRLITQELLNPFAR
jgi:hypothetical protein